jgi:hypothetical protein
MFNPSLKSDGWSLVLCQKKEQYSILYEMVTNKNKGKIIIHPEVNVWNHEILTAKALACAGYEIEFKINKNIEFTKSPDIMINNEDWEMKSPRSTKLVAIERNLKKAYHQSKNIVFDSQRMGRLPDKSIQKELIKQFNLTKNIKKLLFVNRKRDTIDISTLI